MSTSPKVVPRIPTRIAPPRRCSSATLLLGAEPRHTLLTALHACSTCPQDQRSEAVITSLKIRGWCYTPRESRAASVV